MSKTVPTTLCYIKCCVDGVDCYLMIHKSRPNDPNKDKYLRIGGHFVMDETPRQCVLREIYEETGIPEDKLVNLNERGVIHFCSNQYGAEDMYLFTAEFGGNLSEVKSDCDEGELIWYPISKVKNLPIWEGDKLLFDVLLKNHNIDMTLVYQGETLVEALNEGKRLI